MLHAMYIAVVVSYNIHPELVEGELDQTWKDNNIFDFCTFCYLIFNKMINYNPNNFKYSGGTNTIPATHQNKSARDIIKAYARFKRGRP